MHKSSKNSEKNYQKTKITGNLKSTYMFFKKKSLKIKLKCTVVCYGMVWHVIL